ncbi:increased DNA methylation 3-like isoform X2 [Amaranthus tricolor]|uniref:increased DNA methylation 3-like isoform X2 n=1 Tax=Amaranthus tricolor TaxID=29722 RepID=UPI0025911440|nr:increased DNA methylation 3-like isoform X2 [Amaranthus tricolor]
MIIVHKAKESRLNFCEILNAKVGGANMVVHSTLRDPIPVALSGTAGLGAFGPSVGHVDIGISKSAYLFRVALPGVTKENCHLKCEIERDGKVLLRGVVIGGDLAKTRPEKEYDKKVAQLTPAGPFTICFRLPGPVDPRLFLPTFRSDGILEGAVFKYRARVI